MKFAVGAFLAAHGLVHLLYVAQSLRVFELRRGGVAGRRVGGCVASCRRHAHRRRGVARAGGCCVHRGGFHWPALAV